MTDNNRKGYDDITGKPIATGIRPESEWRPMAGATEEWKPPTGGLFQGDTPTRQTERAMIPPNPDGTRPEIVEFPESWPGVKFTEAGLIFATGKDAISHQDYLKLGRWLGAVNRRSKLWVADWVIYGEPRWSHTYDTLIEITGLEYETLKSYVSVGRAVPLKNRILGPQTSKYAAVASLPQRDQLVILKRAKDEDWGRAEIRSAVKDVKKRNTPAVEADPFAEDMAAVASVVPAQPETPTVTTIEFVVPDSLTWADDYYAALRDLLPEDAKAGDKYIITVTKLV